MEHFKTVASGFDKGHVTNVSVTTKQETSIANTIGL